MTPPPPAGALVATVADLSATSTAIKEMLEEQKRWTQQELTVLYQKIKDREQAVDTKLKGIATNVDTLTADVEELKKFKVNHTEFKTALANVEMKAQTDRAEIEALISKNREDNTRDLNASIQIVTNKSDVLDAGLKTVTNQVNKIDSEELPELRKALEEEKSKRRAEDLRLERENESLRSAFDRRVDEVITLIRKDIDSASKKLRDEMATKEDRDKLQREIDQIKQSLSNNTSALEDAIASLKEALQKHRDTTTASFEKVSKDVTQLMKDVSALESALKALTTNTNADFTKVRDSLRDQILALQRDISENRAAAEQGRVTNEKQINVCVSDTAMLKEAKNLVFDKLKIKDVVALVRDWQSDFVPSKTASIKDLEKIVRQHTTDIQKNFDGVDDLNKNMVQVRAHFKQFHTIATGLDPSTAFHHHALDPGRASPGGTKLPPITPR